mmetsp:Transcript_3884/g.5443  ORF Transcript_3884/g.5443 Transcript_3884/m.5443 type:complete len:243 (-) Transcript_3884:143-871(-)
MPTTSESIDLRVKRISNLSQDDVGELQNTGIMNEDDLRYAEFVDLPVGILPVIKRRKLEMIGKFLAGGGALSATITAAEIQQSLPKYAYEYDTYTYTNLRIFAFLCLLVSLYFWSWAVINVINTYNISGLFDFGVVTFFLSGASSVYLLRMSRKGANGFVESPPTYISRVRVLVFLSHFTVAMNYALGGYLALSLETIYAKFAYYCIIFMVLWLFCAVVGWNLITNVMWMKQARPTESTGIH